MSRIDEKDRKTLEETRKEIEEKLFGHAGIGLAKAIPAPSSAAKYGITAAAEISEYYEEDKHKHPEADTTEHVLATAARVAAEVAVKVAAAKCGKFAPLLSAPAGFTGKEANEAIHGLYDGHRDPTQTELATAAQSQASLENQFRADRFQAQLDASDQLTQMQTSAGNPSERKGVSIEIRVHTSEPMQSVPGISKPVYSLSISDGVNTVHTADPLDHLIKNIDNIRDFKICVEENGTCKDISLPPHVQKNLLDFMDENRNTSYWNCQDFAAAAHGLYERGGINHQSGKWKLKPFSESKLASLKSGDFIDMAGGNVAGHAVIYLGEGLYLSKLGYKDGLVVCRLEDMQKFYQTLTKYEPAAELLPQPHSTHFAPGSYEAALNKTRQSFQSMPATAYAVDAPIQALQPTPIYPTVKTYPEEANTAAQQPQEAGIPEIYAQARQAATQPLPLYRNINVPLPSKPLSINATDTVDEVCTKIDSYFDDITRGYPDATRQLVHDIYYDPENKYRDPSKKFLMEGGLGNWNINYSRNNTTGETAANFKWTVDPRAHNCPITIRLVKIHEIGIHIGQAHQRLEQVGADIFFPELDEFNKFTEQSVALSEKILCDALPREIIDRDLKNTSDAEGLHFHQLTGRSFAHWQGSSVDDYVHLQHREDKLTPSHHELFLGNPQVSAFLKTTFPQFYPGTDVNVASTAIYRKALEETVHAFRAMPIPSYTVEKKSQEKTKEAAKETIDVSAYQQALEKTTAANRSIPIPVYQTTTARPSQKPLKPAISEAKKAADEKRLQEIERTNMPVAELNRPQLTSEQLAQFRKTKAAHEAYVKTGENLGSPEAWEFISSVGTLTESNSKLLANNPDFAPFARTLSRASSAISGVVAARAAGMAVAKWTGSAALGTATAGIGFALTAFSTLISFFGGEQRDAIAEAEGRIRKDIKEFHDEFVDYRKEFRIVSQVLRDEIRKVGMMVAQAIVEIRQVGQLCEITLDFLCEIDRFLRENAHVSTAYLQDIHQYPLQNACFILEKHISGKGGNPSKQEVESAQHTVEFWLTVKFKKPLINEKDYASMSSEFISNRLLSHQSKDISMHGFIAALLRKRFPTLVAEKFTALPPLLFASLAEVYFHSVEKSLSPSHDQYESVCDSINSTMQLYEEWFTFLRTHPEMIQALFDQYSSYQRKSPQNKALLNELKELLKTVIPFTGKTAWNTKLQSIESSASQQLVINSGDVWDQLPKTMSEADRVKKLLAILSQDNAPKVVNTRYLLLPESTTFTPIPSQISWASYAAPDGSNTSSWGCSYFPTQPKPNAFVSTGMLFLLLAAGYLDGNYFRNNTLKKHVAQLIASCPSHTYSRTVSEGGWEFREYCDTPWRSISASQIGAGHLGPDTRGITIGNTCYNTHKDNVRYRPGTSETPYRANASVYGGHRANIFQYHASLTETLPLEFETVLKHSTPSDVETYKILFRYHALYSEGKLEEALSYIKQQSFIHDYQKSYLLFLVAHSGRWDIYEAFNKIHPTPLINWVFRDTSLSYLMIAVKNGHHDLVEILLSKLGQLNLKDKLEPAIKIARECGFEKIAVMLEKAQEKGTCTRLWSIDDFCMETVAETTLKKQRVQFDGYKAEFALIIPKEEIEQPIAAQEAETAAYKKGFKIGDSIALAIIIKALLQAEEGGFPNAAKLLASAEPPYLIPENKLSPSEVRALLQAILLKVVEIMPALIDAEEYKAVKWLTQFSHEKITQSLESQGITQALLGERAQENQMPASTRAAGMFRPADASQTNTANSEKRLGLAS